MNIQGPAGVLEAHLDQAPAERTITAVLCHPHPQYGGSMHDGVLDAVAQVLLASGVNCLRFNFRGVGASEGQFDDGVGEVDDLLAACQWVDDEYPRDKLWLVGYSFGAHVVWQALERVEADRAFLIAPPVGAMAFAPGNSETEVAAIAGDADDFVNIDALTRLMGDQVHIIPGADHFFSAHGEALADSVRALLD